VLEKGDFMAKRKNVEPKTVWEYIDWLYLSHRLTAEEHLKLKEHALNLELQSEINTLRNEGLVGEGC
jgi:hypothetical protein